MTSVQLTVTAQRIALYAELTNDYNPIHVDPAFAMATPMGGVIAHGTMSLALIWQMLQQTFGVERAAGASLSVRFVHPVRIGDRLSTEGEPDDETVLESYRVRVVNQDDIAVVTGTVRL